jgi:hypothetical protein
MHSIIERYGVVGGLLDYWGSCMTGMSELKTTAWRRSVTVTVEVVKRALCTLRLGF